MFDFDAFQKMKHIAQEALNVCKERIPTQRDRLLERIFCDSLTDGLLISDANTFAQQATDYFMEHKDEGKKKCKCSDVK